MSELKPYRHDRPCPKCGQHDIMVRWQREHGLALMQIEKAVGKRQDILYRHKIKAAEEHMLRTCRTCQYEWAEAPLDACSVIDQLANVAEGTHD